MKTLNANGKGRHPTKAIPNQLRPGLSPLGKLALAELLTRRQVAGMLQCCYATVANIPPEMLPPVRFSARRVRYRAKDVDRYIKFALGQ